MLSRIFLRLHLIRIAEFLLPFLVLLFSVKKSPRWLVKNGELAKARVVLELVNRGDAKPVLDDIIESIDNEVISKNIYLFKKPYLGLVLVGIAVGFFNQFTGINIIMYAITH